MIAYRVHNYNIQIGELLSNKVYAFTELKTAKWFRKKYRRGYGAIIKIYGYKGRKHKDHPDQRIFEKALVLGVVEIPKTK